MENSLAESIFQAIDIIAKKNAEQINYDSTIICTIVDTSHIQEENYYIVSDGTLQFKAYSENKTYKKNDQVRVSILNNDKTEKKYVIGKYITENSNLVEYVSPTDRILKVLNYSIDEQVKLIVNNDKKEFLFYTIEGKDILLNNLDTLYLEFNVQTNFNEKIKWGNYGIKIDIISSKNKIHTFQFDSDNFLGNPFSFLVSTFQGKTFNILNFEDISKINYYLYQNDNFFTDNGKCLKDNYSNIIFSNIKLGFGFDLTILPDNSIKLFTLDSKNFKYYDDNDNTNKKTIDLLWCNKNENNNFIGFNDGVGKIQQSVEFSQEQQEQAQRLGVTSGRLLDEEKYYLDFSTYDERLYQKEKQDEMDLLSQKETDKLSDKNTLSLSLYVDNINKNLEKALKILNIITTDFNQILTSCDLDNEGDIGVFNARLEEIQDQIQDILYGTKYDNSDNYNILPLKNYYKEIFNIIYKNFKKGFPGIQDFSKPTIKIIKETEEESNFVFSIKTDIFESIRKKIEEENKEKITSYDRRKNNIENLILQFNNIINNINFPSEDRGINKITFTITIDKKELPIEYEIDKDYEEYVGQDFSLYSNLYSIYWYQYEEGYQDEQDLFFKENWKLVKTETEDGNELKNIGLPDIESDNNNLYSDREIYNLKKINDGDKEEKFSIVLNHKKKIEKIKAVIVYNHETFISNELEFLNEDDFEEEIIGKENMLSMVHRNNSKPNYFLYDDTGFLQNTVESVKERTVEAVYKGEQKNLIGAEIYWYLPVNSMLEISNSMLESFKTPIKLDGKNYIQYSKIIGKKEEEDKNGQKIIKVNENDLKFSYKIKNYYSHNFSDNTIKCKIVINDKKQYEAKLDLNFGTFASNGTDYRLIVEPFSENVAVTDKTPLTLNVSLFDQNNKQVKIEPDNLTVDFFGKTTSYKEKDRRENGNSVLITIIKDSSSPPYYGILDVSYEVSVLYNITYEQYNEETEENESVEKAIKKILNAYYPIPWSSNENYSFNGPTKIVYNSQGVNPRYYTGEFSFSEEKVEYSIQYLDTSLNEKFFEQIPPNSIGLPKLSEDNNTILPSNLYVNDSDYYTSIVCKDESGVALWYQPILIIQNRYESNYLNSWSGEEIRIDNKNNAILSTILGAGKKDNNNTFSGVLMGSVGKIGTPGVAGLYGIHQGVQSFGFAIDGTAFIGKPSEGQIIFNGNKGIIKSYNFDNDKKTGTQIDLQTGEIFLYGKGTIKSSNMEINLSDGKISADKFSLDAQIPYKDSNYNFIPEYKFSNKDQMKKFYQLMAQVSLALSVKLWDFDDNNSKLKDYLAKKLIDNDTIEDLITFIKTNVTLAQSSTQTDKLKAFFDVDNNGIYNSGDARLMQRYATDLTTTTLHIKIDNNVGFKISLKKENVVNKELFSIDIGGVSMEAAAIVKADLIEGTINQANIEEATINNADIDKADIDNANIVKASINDANIDAGTIEEAKLKNNYFDEVHYGQNHPDAVESLENKKGNVYFQLVKE